MHSYDYTIDPEKEQRAIDIKMYSTQFISWSDYALDKLPVLAYMRSDDTFNLHWISLMKNNFFYDR